MASLGSVIQKHGFSYPCYADDTQLYLSFHPDDLTIAAPISACLADISCWMKDHHLQLNLAKTELLVVSANPSFHHNFTFQLGSSTITPSKTARNLGVVIDDKLNFTDHITKTAQSCRLLVQALVLSRLDYCNALLEDLPASSIKPLQVIQNAAEKNARHTSVHQFALATNSCSHYIQGINVCLQNHLWLCTPLPKFITSDLYAL